jgi:hypothetical protein
MKKSLLILTAALGLTMSVHAQYSQYGAVEDFYQANVEIDTGSYAGRPVNPTYWLVDVNRWNEYDGRLINGGFVRLGISGWESNNALGGGVPLKELALGLCSSSRSRCRHLRRTPGHR